MQLEFIGATAFFDRIIRRSDGHENQAIIICIVNLFARGSASMAEA
jgi:hypothetical protein